MIELLAPAGGREALIAAVQNGADAIYLGMGNFNARRGAKNFSDEEFQRAMRYCRIRGCKVYVTMNTLVNDREIEQALQTARVVSEAGADGIIIQDLGLASAIRQYLPDIPLHASTQLSGHNASVGRVLAPFGFSRFVIARETSLADLAAAVADEGVSYERGAIASGDQFICQSEVKARIKSNFEAEGKPVIACEMEGAAIGQVGYVNGTPFGILRSISDNGDESAGMSYDKFIGVAVENSVKILTEFLNKTK